MGIWGFGFGFVSFVSRKVSVSPRTLMPTYWVAGGGTRLTNHDARWSQLSILLNELTGKRLSVRYIATYMHDAGHHGVTHQQETHVPSQHYRSG